jgi:hypothetical protein
MHRVKGELLWVTSGDGSAEAEACFRKALEIARCQSAKLLELRALVSLCRLLRRQSRHEEARGMLAAAYGWFTGGFASLDLQEAKEALDGLADEETVARALNT